MPGPAIFLTTHGDTIYNPCMLPQWIIEKKRNGHPLSGDEIRFFINGYTDGSIPDYQMSALAMAVYFQGMDFDEVAVLTDAMIQTGSVLDTSGLTAPTVDKHSTGGIGDKVSLILAPLAASCGAAVPMLSGRGLGITGGTLDKLESIPGYRTDLSVKEFLDTVEQCGCSIMGQTLELAPADRKLYALRDVTGTVPSIPLISASIMSKKLAENTESLVLDVKWGNGAFMKTPEEARKLASTMVEIGARMDRKMAALLTDMNQPLGRTAGNALEVAECIEALRGNGPGDLMEITIALAVEMLILSGLAKDRDSAVAALEEKIDSGSALETFREMVRLHGGSADAVDDPALLPAAGYRDEYPSPSSGYVTGVNAEMIGKACIVLGAGRRKTSDSIDPAVGVSGIVKTGEPLKKGEPLLTIHSNDRGKMQEAQTLLDKAFIISTECPANPGLILDAVRKKNR